VSATVGRGDPTVTVTLSVVVPPAPVQAKVKVVSAVSDALTSLPEVAFLLPVHPPEAVHEVALVTVQLKVDVAL